jgi:hypothetical protein
LAQGDQFGVTALAQPTPPGDELVAKIPRCAIGPPKEVSPRRRKIRNTDQGRVEEWAKRENSG